MSDGFTSKACARDSDKCVEHAKQTPLNCFLDNVTIACKKKSFLYKKQPRSCLVFYLYSQKTTKIHIKIIELKIYHKSSIIQSLRYNITIIFIFLSMSETRGPLSITRAYEGMFPPSGVPFHDLMCIGGSLQVSRKLPTYPSPKPILTLTSHLG